MRLLVALATAIVLTSCGAASPDEADETQASDAAARTCTEVRAGIDAFNRNRYAGTIEHFEKAVAPALEYARSSDDQKADDLLEAVRYYAELPADQYAEAFRTSKEFKKYQRITLGQCETGGTPGEAEGTPT